MNTISSMRPSIVTATTPRYSIVPEEKAGGVTYTPKILSDFVASKIIEFFDFTSINRPIRILDPAVGDGELLISLLDMISTYNIANIEVYGFETNKDELYKAEVRINNKYPDVNINFRTDNFLNYISDNYRGCNSSSLVETPVSETFDLIIANPPYVRTQIMGSQQSKILSDRFGLHGRIDTYYAFILAMATVLHPQGATGIIVSNRFMTTRSGGPVRRAFRERFNLQQIYDLGDTKLFGAAVLPSVIISTGLKKQFTSIPSFNL